MWWSVSVFSANLRSVACFIVYFNLKTAVQDIWKLWPRANQNQTQFLFCWLFSLKYFKSMSSKCPIPLSCIIPYSSMAHGVWLSFVFQLHVCQTSASSTPNSGLVPDLESWLISMLAVCFDVVWHRHCCFSGTDCFKALFCHDLSPLLWSLAEDWYSGHVSETERAARQCWGIILKGEIICLAELYTWCCLAPAVSQSVS